MLTRAIRHCCRDAAPCGNATRSYVICGAFVLFHSVIGRDDEARRYLGRKGWDVSAAVEAAYADGWRYELPAETFQAAFSRFSVAPFESIFVDIAPRTPAGEREGLNSHEHDTPAVLRRRSTTKKR